MSFRVEAGICRQSREGRDIGGQEQLLVMILQQTTKFHPTSPTFLPRRCPSGLKLNIITLRQLTLAAGTTHDFQEGYKFLP